MPANRHRYTAKRPMERARDEGVDVGVLRLLTLRNRQMAIANAVILTPDFSQRQDWFLEKGVPPIFIEHLEVVLENSPRHACRKTGVSCGLFVVKRDLVENKLFSGLTESPEVVWAELITMISFKSVCGRL